MVDDQVVGDDPSVRDRKRADVYDHWLEVAAEDDFVGVQNYERLWYDGKGAVEPAPGLSLNQMGSSVEPASLGGAVRYAHERAGVPDPRDRARHRAPTTTRCAPTSSRASLAGLLNAIDDGVPVIGYLHWTLLDNFEWIFGFDKQLGLVAVDRNTFDRSPKPSAEVYGRIARANTIEL